MNLEGLVSKLGAPPIRSTPTSIASANAARLGAPSVPVIGVTVSATSWMSTSPSKCDLASCIAATFLAPKSPPTFT